MGKQSKYGYTRGEGLLMLYGKHVQADYPKLYDILKQHPKIEKKDREAIDCLDKEVDFLLQRSNGHLTEIIEIVQEEWRASLYADNSPYHEDATKTTSCELCGHKGLLKVFQITNAHTNKTLKVGCECINYYNVEFFGHRGVDREVAIKIAQSRKLQNKNLIVLDQKTNSGIINAGVAENSWKTLPFLPPDPTITKKIIRCINDLRNLIRQVKNSPQPPQQKEIELFTLTLNGLKEMIDSSIIEIKKSSSKWLVSRDVYEWATKNDAQIDTRKHQPIAPILENRGKIDPTNVHLIFEENHVKKCMQLLQKSSLCRQFILEDKRRNDKKVRINVIVKNEKYPFWIPYGRLISEAASLGFPGVNSTSAEIQVRSILLELEELVDVIGINSHEAEKYTRRKCRDAGFKIEAIDEETRQVLIRSRNNMGGTVDLKLILKPVSKDLLGGDVDCAGAIKLSLYPYLLSSFIDAQKDWSELHKDAHPF